MLKAMDESRMLGVINRLQRVTLILKVSLLTACYTYSEGKVNQQRVALILKASYQQRVLSRLF